MVEQIVYRIILPAFRACAGWTDDLFGAIQGSGLVLAAFLVCLVIGLLFVPMRGNAATNIKAYSEKRMYSKRKKGGS